jgi:hypothetical protein
MKKVLLAFLLIALTLGIGSVVWAVIEGTPHDVKIINSNDDEALEPCAMCHTPHKGAGMYPLWNRDQVAQTYTMYSSVSFDMSNGPTAQPQNPSTLCLVCHNGVASTLVNYPGPGPAGGPNDDQYDLSIAGYWGDLSMSDGLGTDPGTPSLSDDHPISFKYDPTKDDSTDNNDFPTAEDMGARKYIRGNATTGTSANTLYPLYNNGGADATKSQFECPTCHSVHNTATYNGQGVTQVFFLRATNENSKLCKDCHIAR